MPVTLTVTVSDETFARLQKRAADLSMTPEAAAAIDLDLHEANEEDPLLKWMGALASGVPDAAERHHEYLGQALYDEMTGRREAVDVR